MRQEINLYNYLPKKTGFDLTKKMVLYSYGAFLLLLLMFHFLLLLQRHKLVIQLNELTTTVSLEQQQLAMIMQKYPVNDLVSLKEVIHNLQLEYENKGRLIDLFSPYANFSAYLEGLGNATVEGVWLTEITFNREGNKIDLKGYTLQPVLLEKLYSRLAMQPIFSDLAFKVNEIKQTSFPASFYITANKANNA
jgi:hypothetical protein